MVLLADNQLVSIVHLKKLAMNTVDLHLILNLVATSESFKSAESWTPICLPKLDTRSALRFDWFCQLGKVD